MLLNHRMATLRDVIGGSFHLEQDTHYCREGNSYTCVQLHESLSIWTSAQKNDFWNACYPV